jgi:hypothetical protein
MTQYLKTKEQATKVCILANFLSQVEHIFEVHF